jgi:hypothetical protein
MKKQVAFEWLDNQELMIVKIKINGNVEVRMALDTGASQTTLDLNVLLMEGISLKESIGKQAVETANGVIITDIFNLKSLQFADFEFKNIPVQVVDFISHGVFSNYSGYLGLDVLTSRDFCIQFNKGLLSFQ